jgi:hypothetical protein
VISEPTALLADVAHRLLVPHAHPRTTAVTVLFAGFLLVCYLSTLALAALHPNDDAAERDETRRRAAAA